MQWHRRARTSDSGDAKPVLICLFSGSGASARVGEELGYTVVTVDRDARLKPTLAIDVRDLTPDMLPARIDVIFASPPSGTFSTNAAQRGDRHAADAVPIRTLAKAETQALEETLAICARNPACNFFIENPRALMRNHAAVARLPHRTVVSLCKYGEAYSMRSTDIFHNCPKFKPQAACCPSNPCAQTTQGGKHATRARTLRRRAMAGHSDDRVGGHAVRGPYPELPEGLLRDILGAAKDAWLGRRVLQARRSNAASHPQGRAPRAGGSRTRRATAPPKKRLPKANTK